MTAFRNLIARLRHDLRLLEVWSKRPRPKPKPPPVPAGRVKVGEPKPKAKTTPVKIPKPPAPKPAPKPTPAPRLPANPRFGIDFAWGTISMAALKKAGVTFVIRYLSNDPSKNLHDAYADELNAVGIDTVVIWETTAARASSGRSAGMQDASTARKQAYECGMPKGRPIYFAVDFNATGPDVAEYFKGAATLLTKGGTGIYGGYSAVSYVMNHAICLFGWQTYAWSGGQWYPKAQLFQYSNGHKIGGVEVDYDHSASVSDFGQWRS